MQNPPTKHKKQKPTIPLLELLAINATGPARLLLKKHGKQDADGYEDLQYKLAELYDSEKDKLAIEKEFAEIHPHKEFILKYLTPQTTITIPEPTSACDGNENKLQVEGLKPEVNNNNFLISAVAIVGIVSLTIYASR